MPKKGWNFLGGVASHCPPVSTFTSIPFPLPFITSSPLSPLSRGPHFRNLFDFTPTQQLRLAVGADFDVDDKGRIARRPFVCVRENCWSLLADEKGKVSVRYDL